MDFTEFSEEWYGYQSYYPSANRYITSASNKKCIFITTSGIKECNYCQM